MDREIGKERQWTRAMEQSQLKRHTFLSHSKVTFLGRRRCVELSAFRVLFGSPFFAHFGMNTELLTRSEYSKLWTVRGGFQFLDTLVQLGVGPGGIDDVGNAISSV